mmetsp:Transcript_68664/g.193716  ORF Transcript_68664/g.193716 Transcript_68664/m.193716 type:complete len:288 (-) Transcript_68664:718-1581(-)
MSAAARGAPSSIRCSPRGLHPSTGDPGSLAPRRPLRRGRRAAHPASTPSPGQMNACVAPRQRLSKYRNSRIQRSRISSDSAANELGANSIPLTGGSCTWNADCLHDWSSGSTSTLALSMSWLEKYTSSLSSFALQYTRLPFFESHMLRSNQSPSSIRLPFAFSFQSLARKTGTNLSWCRFSPVMAIRRFCTESRKVRSSCIRCEPICMVWRIRFLLFSMARIQASYSCSDSQAKTPVPASPSWSWASCRVLSVKAGSLAPPWNLLTAARLSWCASKSTRRLSSFRLK